MSQTTGKFVGRLDRWRAQLALARTAKQSQSLPDANEVTNDAHREIQQSEATPTLFPSTNGANGGNEQKRTYLRDGQGRFGVGNCGGPGNPRGRQIARIRRAFRRVVDDAAIEELARVVLRDAKAGNAVAAREVLRRVGVKQVTVVLGVPRERMKKGGTISVKGVEGVTSMTVEEFMRWHMARGR